jgi:hypothetical protein
VELESPPEIGKIQKFGRFAQAGCVALFVILAVSGPVTVLVSASESGWSITKLKLGRYFAIGEPPPMALVMWSVFDVAVMFTLCCVAVGYLYFLFGALGRGSIYTPDNVRRIRRIGQLVFALGALQFTFPVFTLALMAIEVMPKPAAWAVDADFGPDALVLLVAGGLILLVSWIMEVGRRASEDAEQMRRDAELVV